MSIKKTVIIALGGNAISPKNETGDIQAQFAHTKESLDGIMHFVRERYNICITHGNGPQVGLLALQSASYEEVEEYPLDVLGAQTEGMIGYMIEQEMGNLMPTETAFATILTMVEVDPEDPAFNNPTKPIGPMYSEGIGRALSEEKGWAIAKDGDGWRRVVPSPIPHRIFELRPIHWLLEKETVVICAGGGGIPTLYNSEGDLEGVEVVIDKDRASALLARQLNARLLVLATDADGVYTDWGSENAKRIENTTPEEIEKLEFDIGSMGPKVEAACDFVRRTGERAVIGALSELEGMVKGTAGTQFTIE